MAPALSADTGSPAAIVELLDGVARVLAEEANAAHDDDHDELVPLLVEVLDTRDQIAERV